MKCKVCNYENSDQAQYCTQCGTILNPILENGLDAYSDPKSNCNTLAIVGLIMSLVAICLFFIPFQWVVSFAGFLISLIARVQLMTDGKKGKDLALAGIILSVLSGIFNILIYNGWFFNHWFYNIFKY